MTIVATIALVALGAVVALVIVRYISRGVAAVADELQRRLDLSIAFVASAVNDPVVDGKASMARICAGVAIGLTGVLCAAFIRFVFANHDHDGIEMAKVIVALIVALSGTTVLGLLLRKNADGSTEADDDVPAPVIAQTNVEHADSVKVNQ